LEQLKFYKYLGPTVNGIPWKKKVRKEFPWAKAYYANQKIFKSKLVSKKAN